jgi:hypothetical protein
LTIVLSPIRALVDQTANADMKRTGAVTPLAADGRLGDVHPVQAAADGLRLPGVTDETAVAVARPKPSWAGWS